jgi:hypothetical protein
MSDEADIPTVPADQIDPEPDDPSRFLSVIDVLRDAGEPLRLIEVAKRCNNGCNVRTRGRRTSTEILREIEALVYAGKVARLDHPLGGNWYEARRGR